MPEPAFHKVRPICSHQKCRGVVGRYVLTRCYALTIASLFFAGPSAVAQALQTDDVGDIVVTGTRRDQIGALRRLTAQDIKALGASSIADVVRRLGAQAQGADGASPVFALDGRRPLDDEEVQSLPLEAIESLDILGPEAAARIGYPATQPVMNLVTKARYRGFEAQADGSATTDGGGGTEAGKAILTRLKDKQRLTLTASMTFQHELRQDRRSIEPDASLVFDEIGNITGLNQGEIDPALSKLSGRPIIVAAVPSAPDARRRLSGYLLGAGRPRTTDLGPYRSLRPGQRTIKVSSFYSRPLNSDVTASLSLSAEKQRSDALQGLAAATLTIPARAVVSPFGTDVLLNRYLLEAGPLRQWGSVRTLHAGAGLTGNVSGWNWQLRLVHDLKRASTQSEFGYDLAAAQAAVDSGMNPFEPFSPEVLGTPIVDHARSISANSDAQFLLDGSLLNLPAGEVRMATTIRGQLTAVSSMSTMFPESDARFRRRVGGGDVNLTVPITSPASGAFPFLGRLTAEISGGISAVSRFSPLATSRFGLLWAPARGIELHASIRHTDTTPPLDRQAAPTVVTPNVPFVDLVTGENVLVTATAGGNLLLRPERRQTVAVTANLRPLKNEPLRASLTYEDSITRDPTLVFSTLTPAIERAFPDRFLRDGAGNLTSVDFRAVNAARERQRLVKAALSYAGPIGPKPLAGAKEAAATGPNLTASLTSTVRLEDRLLFARGAPDLNLLGGDTIAATGGPFRWTLQADFGLFQGGLGFLIQSFWRSGKRARSDLPSSDLRFRSLGTSDVSLFADLETLLPSAKWATKATVEFSIRNVGNARPTVVDRFGMTPNSLQPAYLDPAGRTVSLNFLKRF